MLISGILLSFLVVGSTLQTQAQWAGTWITNFEEIKINANSGQIRFELGDYLFSGTARTNATKTDYTLSGTYNLKPTNAPRPQGTVIKHQNQFGAQGTFSIKLDRTQQSFSGEYVNSSNNNRKGEFKGKKVNTISNTDKNANLPSKSVVDNRRNDINKAVEKQNSLTGTWVYKSGNTEIQLKIVQTGNDRIRVKSYETYKNRDGEAALKVSYDLEMPLKTYTGGIGANTDRPFTCRQAYKEGNTWKEKQVETTVGIERDDKTLSKLRYSAFHASYRYTLDRVSTDTPNMRTNP